MNRRNLLTTALAGFALSASALDVSDKGDTLLKVIQQYKFQKGKAHYLVMFADIEMQQTIKFQPNADFKAAVSEVENQLGFKEWVGVNFDDQLFITIA